MSTDSSQRLIRALLYTLMLGVLFTLSACIETPTDSASSVGNAIEHKQAVKHISALMVLNHYDEALVKIDQLITELGNDSADLKAWLYHKQAYIYEQRRHFHYAITALTKANQQLPSQQQFVEEVQALQKVIDGQQQERNQRTHYQNSRNSGMAKQLSQDITIAYIYLDDNQWSKWTLKSRVQNQQNIERVKQWYLKQATSYDIDKLNIDVRYFYLKSPKGISKEWLRSKAFFNQAQSLVTRQLGYIDFREFVEAMSDYDKQHDVALVFHSNNQARSFARSCKNTVQRNNCFFEYIMLTEQMNHPLYAWAMPQIQAHEILHLFGASDLYNIYAAKDYAVTDLMNYYSDSIQHATIEPITAWSIGWQELPDTPFPVNVIKEP